MLALAGSRAPSTWVQVPALVIPGTCAYRSWPISMVLTLISAFGPLAVSWAAALPCGASTEPVIRKPEPDDAVRVKLVWSSCSTACESLAAAAGSADVVALGAAAPALLGALAPVVLSPQPAVARATVAMVARPSPASLGVRMSVLPDVYLADRHQFPTAPVGKRFPGTRHDGWRQNTWRIR